MSRRYLACLLVAVTGGMLVAWQQRPIGYLLSFFGFLWVAHILPKAKHKCYHLTFLIFILILYLSGYHYFQQKETEYEQSVQYFDQLKDGEVTGILFQEQAKAKTKEFFLKDAIVRNGKRKIRIGRILIRTDLDSDLVIGSKIRARGSAIPFSVETDPGGFSERMYYKSQNICGKLQAQEIKVLEEATAIRQWIKVQRDRFRETLQLHFEPKQVGVMETLLLGERQQLDGEIKELYQKGGMAHILAISGLHISMIGMGAFRLMKKIGSHTWSAALISLLGISLFVAMSGGGVSAQRAWIMFLLYLIAQVTGRAYDGLTAWSIAGVLLLGENPLWLLNQGFQLSFVAVFGVLWIYQTVHAREDRYLENAILLYISVQLVLLPFTIHMTGEVPVYGILLNLICLPFATLLLGGGLAGIWIACGSQKIAGVIFLAPRLILRFYEWIFLRIESLPYANWVTGEKERSQFICYYVGVVLLAIAWNFHLEKRKKEKNKEKKERRSMRLKKKVWMLLAVLWMMALILWSPKKGFCLAILDVGQGDGIFLRNESGDICLIDGGSSSKERVGTYVILPFLKWAGAKEIDLWFVSHTDQDHISGVIELLEAKYPVRTLVLARYRGRGENEEKLQKAARKSGTKILEIEAGQEIYCHETKIRCVYPDAGAKADLNDASMALQIRDLDFCGFFGGDLSIQAEERMLERNKLWPCWFYKCDHHGSKGSNAEMLLQQLGPKVSVASAGPYQKYGHPAPEVVERIKKRQSRFYNTRESGCILLKRKGRGMYSLTEWKEGTQIQLVLSRK